MNRISQWHIVISGYTQDKGYVHGCARLFQRMLTYNGPGVRIELLEWNEDFADFAAWMQSLSAANARIHVYAYSWGCGNGLVRLAEQLDLRGLSIDRAVLSDPVYRSKLLDPIPILGHILGPIARGIGVLRRGTIKLPPNIRRVTWLRQKNNLPSGCDLVATNPTTQKIDDVIDMAWLRHEQMDDAEDWHRLSLDAAAAA